MPLDSLVVFFGASVLLALAPGPDNMFVLSLSLNHGPRAGLLVVSGLCSGLLVHTLLVASGLATLLLAAPAALNLVASAGALYLLYLAWVYWQPASDDQPSEPTNPSASPRRLYLRGFIMNVTNPKVGVFFLAFLPQFIDPTHPQASLQVALLGLLFILSTILVFGSIALVAGRYHRVIADNAGTRLWMARLTSLLLVLLAMKLFGNWLA